MGRKRKYNTEEEYARIRDKRFDIPRLEKVRQLFVLGCNCGSMAIRDKICEALGIKPWDAPFTTKVHDNVEYQFLIIEYK